MSSGWPIRPSGVRAFKVEFDDRVVEPYDFLEIELSLTSPGDLLAGAPAFNSFA